MNKLKAFMTVGALLAVTAAAGAAQIPFSHGYNGTLYMHMNDYSMGTTYTLTDPNLLNTWLPVDNAALVASPATGSVDGEEGWSIIRLDQIFEGTVVSQNTISPTNLGNPLYDVGGFTGGVEVYGVVRNRQDLFVRTNDDGTQNFMFQNDIVELYAQPTGTYETATRTFLGLPLDGSGDPSTGIFGAAGSSGRLAADVYVGIGYDENGVAIPGVTMTMRWDAEAGYFPAAALAADPNYDAVEGRGAFEPSVSGVSGSGDFDAYYSVTGGDDGYWQSFDNDFFTPTRISGADFANADFRVHVTNAPVTPSGDFDWLLQSSDPVTGSVVPEPITMIGAMMGIGGIGAYIRKRR